jgi:hypothetical protein
MRVNWPKHRSVGDAGGGLPLVERNYRTPSASTVRNTDFTARAVLVCFRTAEGNFEALTDGHHIFAI